MALNLSDTSNFTPHIRWMASTSSWQASSEGGPEIVSWSEAVFDLGKIRTGWLNIQPGVAPDFRPDPDLKTVAPKPTGDGGEWKRGFSVTMFGEQVGGLRDWTTNSKGALIGIEQLHDAYEKAKGDNAGKVPVVSFGGGKPMKMGQGHTSVPQFSISKWVDRPSGMDEAAGEADANASDAEFS